MKSMHLNQEIVVFTTPTELRQIAERMEREWLDSGPGDSMEAAVWARPGLSVSICADQEHMARNYPRRQQQEASTEAEFCERLLIAEMLRRAE